MRRSNLDEWKSKQRSWYNNTLTCPKYKTEENSTHSRNFFSDNSSSCTRCSRRVCVRPKTSWHMHTHKTTQACTNKAVKEKLYRSFHVASQNAREKFTTSCKQNWNATPLPELYQRTNTKHTCVNHSTTTSTSTCQKWVVWPVVSSCFF